MSYISRKFYFEKLPKIMHLFDIKDLMSVNNISLMEIR